MSKFSFFGVNGTGLVLGQFRSIVGLLWVVFVSFRSFWVCLDLLRVVLACDNLLLFNLCLIFGHVGLLCVVLTLFGLLSVSLGLFLGCFGLPCNVFTFLCHFGFSWLLAGQFSSSCGSFLLI